MGLPEISITFSSLAVSAVERSQRGIVALILRDATKTTPEMMYSAASDVSAADWTAGNLQFIKDAFMGTPYKVLVVRGAVNDEDYNDQLSRLSAKRFNYLAIPGIAADDVMEIASWIKTQRILNKKTFKAVLPNVDADYEGIVNFATGGIVVGERTCSASEYTARIAGILAGLPLERSATYYELAEVSAITESANPDADIDDGKLILINDDESIKIGRAVNSLTTLVAGKGDDWMKIKIIEGHDLVQDDIRTTFNNNYVGKVVNSYDNQVLFLTSVNAYLRDLEGIVLDAAAVNAVSVDVAAQRSAWASIGTDVSALTDDDIKRKAFQSQVFLSGSLKFLDAMEDLQFKAFV
ncbi:phage tail sheath C-terminal domain-containing protein [Paenibacillus aurantiacus]|uniref:Phage tail sheath C-terminal domain-containing protein n=1 Tax=Paenibacillus aurantiacus TaxID=1936118 RepID=A0ABV5KP36_9BACL